MNKQIIITNAIIQNPGEEKFRGNILIEDNKIIEIIDDIPVDADQIDVQGCIVTPGLIDQHIHGGYGCDFNTADVETIIYFLTQLPRHGVTAIYPTIMTDEPETIRKQIANIKEAKQNLPGNAAKILGIHLEGPFLNPAYKGAHPQEIISPPNIEKYKQIESDEIKIVTLAPELDKNFELINYLTEKGVIVSVGHTNAPGLCGLKRVTHIFNAMTPLHHRKPGVIGEALVNNEVSVEVIADHNHLHPDIVKLILRSKPKDRVIFVSDSLPLNQSDENSTIFGGQQIFKQGEIAASAEGVFAGSLMFMDDIIRKNINIIDFKDLLMFCCFPNRITKGMDADLVFWDQETYNILDYRLTGTRFSDAS